MNAMQLTLADVDFFEQRVQRSPGAQQFQVQLEKLRETPASTATVFAAAQACKTLSSTDPSNNTDTEPVLGE